MQGTICAALSTGNPAEAAYKAQRDALNFMMSDLKVDKETQVKVRAYARNTKQTKKRLGYNDLIAQCLSRDLSAQLRAVISKAFLWRVWYLKYAMDACTRPEALHEELLGKINRVAYGPSESIPADQLTFIITGMAFHTGRVLMPNDFFGQVRHETRGTRRQATLERSCPCTIRAARRLAAGW